MENLRLDDFTKYKFLSGIQYSPNGKNLAFLLHQMDVEKNKYLSNIYIYNMEKGQPFKLTAGNEENSFLFKDEDTILFPALRDEKDKSRKENGEDLTCYYEISLLGGEANKVLEIPLNVNKIEILDENSFILTALYDHNKLKLEGLSKEEKEDEKDYQVIDEIPFWSNGQGFTNKKRNRLYIYNLEENEITPITDEFTDVESFKLNQDKSRAIIIANSFIDKMHIRSDLYIYHIKENTLEKITHDDPFSYSYADFLEDKIIFTGSHMTNYGVNENNHIYIMDDKGNAKVISPKGFDYSLWNSVGADIRYGSSTTMKVDGEYLYFITTEYNSSYINRIDQKGNIEKLTIEKGSVDGFDVLNGKIIFIGLRELKLQELYEVDSYKEIQLTNYNQWVIDEKKLSIPERLTFETEEGVTIEGWVLKPVDFDENKKYPGILDIHGGPKTVYGEVFFHEMQYWANEGYVVFFCNPRGSDGRGDEFADIRDKYGTIDYKDIMKFTDIVLENYPFIDEDRLGVTGGSYGGFMTNWIIGHTNRFKAAASQRSISNWVSKFGTTDIGYFFVDDQQGATPWEDVDKLWFHSPLKYAHKVMTPTLFIHSEEDYRCWMAEAIQMFTALKYHGVESRLCLFKGENHELSRSGKPKHRLRRLKEITGWFDRYLK
ncbi:S9 family peptidase [Clostridium sp. Cult1]|jgi:dipeptidyl aminopeptidase/acylaminoacyl peptidase|uniref:S9 family peptidase n=1 Tax=Clostridium sp. Cult1 TaxID=2079002 RepID=UPI001F46408A|nr:S9 family peptidase [Clostridium sp. Cult1]MCF6464005.1 S9 family peptidase [Clostridium sp. Cult1]